MISSFLSLSVAASLATSSSIAHATEPADPAGTEADAPDDDDTTSTEAREADDPGPATDDPATETAPASAEPLDDETAPKVYDSDTNKLLRQPSRRPAPVSDDGARPLAGGLLLGLGVTAAVVAPVVVVRPRPAISIVADTNGLALDPKPGPLAAGGVIAAVGGVATIVGGRILSNLDADPERARAHRRGLQVASGVAFGVAVGLFAAGVTDLARGGVLWSDVLEREMDPNDVLDGEEAARRMSRGIGMIYAAVPMAGLGLGLRLGDSARARVVSTGTGLAVAGRF